MIRDEMEFRTEAVAVAARETILAIRTSPKTRGRDNLSILLADGPDLEKIAAAMDEVFKANPEKRAGFARDAKNVRASQAVILVGVKNVPCGLDCGGCGFPSCAEKAKMPAAYCVFNTIDLGIGVGAAGAALADRRVDNRLMFSIGYAAVRMGLFPDGVTVAIGIPLSVSGKSPYFDR